MTKPPQHAKPGDRYTDDQGIVRCLSECGRDWVPVGGKGVHFARSIPHEGTVAVRDSDRHVFVPMRNSGDGTVICRRCGHEKDYEAHTGAREEARA